MLPRYYWLTNVLCLCKLKCIISLQYQYANLLLNHKSTTFRNFLSCSISTAKSEKQNKFLMAWWKLSYRSLGIIFCKYIFTDNFQDKRSHLEWKNLSKSLNSSKYWLLDTIKWESVSLLKHSMNKNYDKISENHLKIKMIEIKM